MSDVDGVIMANREIPKIIHYCWFGQKRKPRLVRKCIASWKKYCPEYEIKCWDESNVDLDYCKYLQEAYDKKKWAFVSDVVRFIVLYKYGGLYFDTDVELIRPIEDLVLKGSFLALEPPYRIATGLGMCAYKKHSIYKEIIDSYISDRFINTDGNLNTITVVDRVTKIFINHGYKKENIKQIIKDITIYPSDYFCPKSYEFDEPSITNNTRAIHYFTGSWLDKDTKRNIKWIKYQNWFDKHNLKEYEYLCSLIYKLKFFQAFGEIKKSIKNKFK